MRLVPRPRSWLAPRFKRIAEKWTGTHFVSVPYPPPARAIRYGHGRPPHEGLLRVLGEGDGAYRRNLELITAFREDLARISLEDRAGIEPAWLNAWLPALDAAALYAFVRDRAPAHYLEIGSGMSTRFARRAIADGDLATRITSIDPAPRQDVETLVDQAVRAPLESADLGLLDQLAAGDIVFMDGSHQVFAGSDATVFFLDVLPRLPAGVLVAVHDVLLPDDYLPEWEGFHWSEQYLLAAHLLAGGSQIALELAAYYVTEYSRLGQELAPLWEHIGLAPDARRGFCLWFSTTGAGPG